MRSIVFLALISGPLALAESIPFDAALARIVTRSTAVQTQEANVRLTEAGAIPARMAFAPSVSFDSKYTRSGSPAITPMSYQFEATSQFNVFHWGADLAALRASGADVDTQQSLLESTRLSAEDAGIAALVAQIQAKKTIEINRQIVEVQTQLYKIAQERYRGGYLARQEVDKIAVDLDNAKASLSDAELQEATSRTQLDNLLGSPDIVLEWPWISKLEQAGQRLMSETWVPDARPDIQAAQEKLRAEDQRATQNARLLLPSVDANLAYGYYQNPFAGATAYGYAGWTAGLTLSLPFLDHGVTYSNWRQQESRREQADVAQTQALRDAQASWDGAKNSFRIALAAALSRDKTLATSRDLYQDSLKRFRAGRISANDLVVDQQRLLNSELYALQAWANAHLQYPKLCHAFGRRLERCLE